MERLTESNALSQPLNCSVNGKEILNQEQLLSRFDDDRYEMFFMKIPKTFDPEHFKGERISLSGKTKIKVNNEVYIFQPSEDSQSIWMYNNCLKKFHSVKHIIVEKSIKTKKHQPQGEVQPDTPLCVNVGSRNPFFTAQYEREITLDSIVKQKLDKADAKLKKLEMRKVHKRKLAKNEANEVVTSTENECQEEIFKLLGSHHFDLSKKPRLSVNGQKSEKRTSTQSISLERTSDDVKPSKKRKKVEPNI